MALPALIPVIMMGGRIIGRVATKRLASQLAGKLGKGQRIVNKPASQAKNVPNVTSVSQAKNLKPSTKVAGKRPSGSMTQQTTPKSKPLRADPKDRISTPAKKAKTTATGTPTQRKILGAGMTAASLSTLIPKKESGKSQAKTGSSNLSAAQKEAAAKRRITQLDAREKRLQADSKRAKAAAKNSVKTWKDYKTVAAAQAAGSDFFVGKDGKKKLAITKEQLDKSGMSLTGMANKLRKERNATVKNLVAKAVKSSKGKA